MRCKLPVWSLSGLAIAGLGGPAAALAVPGLVSQVEAETAQVTAVSQLSDVRATDWAFTALQSLVERYGCVAGYPDRTFRGQGRLSRFEFAAGVNACLSKINELLTAGLADKVGKEDVATLQRLQEEFAAELGVWKGRVDTLETQTEQLEAQQFSVTTKLTGEALMQLRADFTGTDLRPDNSGAVPGLVSKPLAEGGEGPAGRNTTLGYRARLDFQSSFTGQDRLLVRLQASNIPRQGIANYTNQGALHPDDATGDRNNVFGLFPGSVPTGQTSDNQVRLEKFTYRFPAGDRLQVQVTATGGRLWDFAPTLNALDYGDKGLGSITEFGRRNPIYRLSGAGAGAGLDYRFSEWGRLSAGYLGGNRVSAGVASSNTVRNPFGAELGSTGNGLTGGTYGAIAQLTVTPNRDWDLGLTYVRSFFSADDVFAQRPGVGGGVGSHHADFPLGGGPMELNSYGVQTRYRFSPGLILSGWVGFTDVRAPLGGINPLGDRLSQPGATANLFNWAVTLAFPDLFKSGALGGLVFGQSPKVTRSDGRFAQSAILTFGSGPLEDRQGESYHIEAFYQYPLSSRVTLTPGIVWVTNPEYNAANPSFVLATLRLTFSF